MMKNNEFCPEYVNLTLRNNAKKAFQNRKAFCFNKANLITMR